MLHYTLNTGYTADSPRAAADNDVVGMLRPLVRSGGRLPAPFAAFGVTLVPAVIGGTIFTVHRARKPIITCGVAWTDEGASAVWQELEKFYYEVSDRVVDLIAASNVPEMPATLPWLAVVVLPEFALTSAKDLAWIGDFEHCFAWAIIEAHATA